MPLLIDLLKNILVEDAGSLAGAASLVYTGTVTGVVAAALFSRRPDRRRAARDVLATLLRHAEKPSDAGRNSGPADDFPRE